VTVIRAESKTGRAVAPQQGVGADPGFGIRHLGTPRRADRYLVVLNLTGARRGGR
jgi:hypothetical protein